MLIIEFIRELFNQPEAFIPLHAPVFMGNEKKYMNECIDTSYVSSIGKFVNQFENLIAKYTQANYAAAVVNGTAALHLALILAEVKPDDEVITQALTFVATANAIKHTGATPIFVDVDMDTMGMSPEKLAYWLKNNTIAKVDRITNQKVTYNKRTKKRIAAIVPMHTFGHPCRIDEIVEISKLYNINVVEDSAESLGSFYKGKHTGTFGKLGIFSFNGNKIITAGGGGVIVTNNEALANKAKHISTTAKVSHPFEFIHDEIGYNYRLTNVNAALGVAQMEKLESILKNKRETAKKYICFFKNLEDKFIIEPKYCTSNYWLNAIILKDSYQKDLFLKQTKDCGIMTRPIWRLINNLEMYKNCMCGDLSNSEWLRDRVVNIPSSYRP